MKVRDGFGFYGILTNPKVGYEKLAAEMVKHEVPFIQLRMKEAGRTEILKMAKKLRGIIGGTSRFIVNDSPRVAAEVGADGVHLGQGDMSYGAARKILGEDAIIGLSTHNPGQTLEACGLGPDYIGIGPVFATPTKKVPDPPIGIDGMKEMLAVATLPAVVLGSIDGTNGLDVLRAGARNLCCVRYINQSENPGRELQTIKNLIRSV